MDTNELLNSKIPQLHPIQWKILNNFRTNESLKFNQIKNFEIDPRNFVYHLNKLIEYQLIKYSEGSYVITTKGKLMFEHFLEGVNFDGIPLNSFIGLYVVRDGKVLVAKRNQVPYLDHVGIPTFGIDKDLFIHESAKLALKTLGLEGVLIRPLIVETIYRDEEGRVTTHSNMHVFYCANSSGENIIENVEGELFWLTPDELLKQENGYEDSRTLVEFFNNNKVLSDIKVISRVDSKTSF
jgi:hypothetical protein